MNTRQVKLMLMGAIAVFCLCACDDDAMGASENQPMSFLESGTELGGCSKANAGEIVYVTDSSAVYFCAEGKWQSLNGKDGKDGAAGKDGVNGADGKNGENGSSGVSTKDTVVVRDTVVVNNRDTVVVRDTLVVINRDTVVVKEQSSGGSGNSGESSLVGKANWAYLNPAINYGEITDERDGQVYKTVKIGGQTWMAENMNFEYKVEGEAYGATTNSLKDYGYRYTWAAAMDSAGVYSTNGKDCGDSVYCSPTYPVRGICPEGWHLPSTSEWKALYQIVDSSYTSLQAVGRWTYASNISGFSALPTSTSTVNEASFWSATPNGLSANRWRIKSSYHASSESVPDKSSHYSVRCLKD